nr:hypothetical protein HK105_002209 [Polyrhizophydium stewartii]
MSTDCSALAAALPTLGLTSLCCKDFIQCTTNNAIVSIDLTCTAPLVGDLTKLPLLSGLTKLWASLAGSGKWAESASPASVPTASIPAKNVQPKPKPAPVVAAPAAASPVAAAAAAKKADAPAPASVSPASADSNEEEFRPVQRHGNPRRNNPNGNNNTEERDKCSIFLRPILETIDEETLRAAFAHIGTIRQVEINHGKHMGFIEFASQELALKAIGVPVVIAGTKITPEERKRPNLRGQGRGYYPGFHSRGGAAMGGGAAGGAGPSGGANGPAGGANGGGSGRGRGYQGNRHRGGEGKPAGAASGVGAAPAAAAVGAGSGKKF